jgi:hypothetical protein
LQEHEGAAATFIADVTRGWRMAEADTASEIDRGEQGRSLAFETRYALILASINDLGAGIPPPLLARLVEAGIWTLAQGRTYAWQVPALNGRALSLAAVAGQARGIIRHEILEQALACSLAIGNEGKRTEALANLAPHLCAALLPQALAAVRTVTYAPYRVRAFAGILLHLSEPLKSEALKEALSVMQEVAGEDAQVEAINALAKWFPVPDREAAMRQVLAKIRAAQYEFSKVELIKAASPHLTESLLPEAMSAAREITMDIDRGNALLALAPRLAEFGRQTEALRLVQSEGRRGGDQAKAQALTKMAPNLDEEHLRQALEAAGKLYVAEDRAEAIVGLSPHLSEKLLRRALTIVGSMKHAVHQVEPLAVITRLLPEGKIKEQLEIVMTTAMREYDSQAARSEALARLAPHLPDGQLRLALSESRRIDDEKRQVKAMAIMAAVMSPAQRAEAARHVHQKAQAIDTERDRFEALVYVTPLIAETIGVEEALGIALSIEHPDHCAWALTGLFPRLLADKRDEILMKVLTRWHKTRHQAMLPEAFNHLAPYLSESLWQVAVTFTQEIEWASCRGGMLSSLMRHAANIERLRSVYPLVLNIPDERARTAALMEFARQLARLGYPEEALGLAHATPDELRRVEVFEGVIPYLPLPLLLQVAAVVEELTYDGRRWSVLANLAPRFAALGEWTVAVQLLNSIKATNKHALAAASMVVCAPASDRERLVEHALNLAKEAQDEFEEGEDWWLGKALARLAPSASSTQLEAILELALKIADPVARDGALSAISTELLRLQPPAVYRLWSKAMHSSAEVSRADLLANLLALMPVTTYLGVTDIASEIFQAIHDVGQWWPA